jgi:hypothetical protein
VAAKVLSTSVHLNPFRCRRQQLQHCLSKIKMTNADFSELQADLPGRSVTQIRVRCTVIASSTRTIVELTMLAILPTFTAAGPVQAEHQGE